MDRPEKKSTSKSSPIPTGRGKKITIQARSIYADPNKTYRLAGDAPEGCVFAYRYHDGGRQYKIGQPWPEFTPGQEIEIETTNHYVWVGRVESRVDEDTIVFRPAGPKVALPLPPYAAGQPVGWRAVRSAVHRRRCVVGSPRSGKGTADCRTAL